MLWPTLHSHTHRKNRSEMTKNRVRILLGSVCVGAAAMASVINGPAANATPTQAVCNGIDQELASGGNYLRYLIRAGITSYMIGYDTETQAKNIVDSIRTYCPEHMSGMALAANALSN